MNVCIRSSPRPTVWSRTTELARRYKSLGGSAEIVVIQGLGHGGQVLCQSEPLANSLLTE
jgi:hypothetical protein